MQPSVALSVHSLQPLPAFGRLAVVTAAVGLLAGAGVALDLRADAYVLMTLPLAVIFQRSIARRPVRAMWVRRAPRHHWSLRDVALAGALAVVPAHATWLGLSSGDPVTTIFGLAAIVGAPAAVYALANLGPGGRWSLARLAIGLSVAGGLLVRATLGPGSDPTAALLAGVGTALLYLPATFIAEEMLFRGVLDPYLAGHTASEAEAGSSAGWTRASLVVGTMLWGAWHLPLFPGAGLEAVVVLIAYHVVVGIPLAWLWRHTGTLAHPAVAHAILDAVRNALLVR